MSADPQDPGKAHKAEVELAAVDPNAAVIQLAQQLEARAGAPPPKSVAKPVQHSASKAPLIVGALAVLGVAAAAAYGVMVMRAEPSEDPEASAAVAAAHEPAIDLDAPLPGQSPADMEADYRARVEATASARGFTAPTLEQLAQPNHFEHHVDHGNPEVIPVSGSRRDGPLSLKVRVDNVHVERGGLESSTKMTTLEVTNRAEVPVAYRLEVRKGGAGDCRSEAVVEYDAMVLDPGQKASIAICAGAQSVEILDFRTLEVTPLGAAWIRQLPPEAVDQPDAAIRAHKVGYELAYCDPRQNTVAAAIKQSKSRWEDVVDFFSRHDCNQHEWWPEYRRAEAPVVGLPLAPPPDSGR